jgi:hypothetical protein
MSAAMLANDVDLRILAEEGKKARIKLARNGHLKSFCELVMIDEETGKGIDMAPVHMAWHTLADEYNRLLIWAHVESGKTQQMAVARTLWDLGHNHNLRTAIVSNTKGQSVKIARAIKSYIESSDNLHAVFPDLLPGKPWGEQQFSVRRKTHAKDPSVQCAGVHGNILGSRIDRLVLDDILDYENTRTAHARNDLKHWYKSTLGGRLTASSSIRSIGTAWHPEDLLHEFAKSRLWKAYVYPVVDANGNPRWPERWTPQRISDKLEELGPVEFSRQMLCQARDDASATFKREWIERCLVLGEGRTMATALSVLPRGYSTYTGVDLAVQKHDAADYTVFFTIAVDPFGNRHVLEIDSGRWSGPEIVLKIQSCHRRFQSIVIVENNAAQDFILQFSRGASAVPVRAFTTGRNKAHPAHGVQSISTEMYNGKWFIPNMDGAMSPEVSAWIDEMLYYDPAGHTGDRLMASWFAREGTRMGQKKVKNKFNVDLLRR